MAIDAKALRAAITKIAVDFKLEAIATVAVDQEGVVLVILTDNASAYRQKACQHLAVALNECLDHAVELAERDSLEPEPSNGSSVN